MVSGPHGPSFAEEAFDERKISWHDVERARQVVLDCSKWNIEELSHELMVVSLQDSRTGIQPGDDRQSRRWRGDGEHLQVRSILCQAQDRAPDVASVKLRDPFTTLRQFVERN